MRICTLLRIGSNDAADKTKSKMNTSNISRNDIKPGSLSAYGSYKNDDGETIRTQLAETNDGKHAVRAYTADSGTEIYRGPFATEAEAEAVADEIENEWQGFAE